MFNDNNQMNNNQMFNDQMNNNQMDNNGMNNMNNMNNNMMNNNMGNGFPPQNGKKKSNNIIIILVVVIAAIAIGAVVAWPKIQELLDKDNSTSEEKDDKTDKDNNKDDNKEDDEEDKDDNKTKEKEYKVKYNEYLEDKELYEKDKVEAVLIDFDDNGTPELVIKYLNNSNASTLKVLYIRGDEVRESDEYPYSYLSILYDVKTGKPNYYFEHKDYDVSYYKINDIISDKVDIEEFEVDDEFEYKYIRADVNFDMYSLNESSLESDLERLIEKYDEKDSYISEDLETDMKDKIEEIKKKNITKDSTGLHAGDYTAEYGTYTLDDMTFVFNSNDSCTFNSGSTNANGSFYVEYDVINFVSTGYKFKLKIIGNNKLQLIDSDYWAAKENTIWNKK